jgi:cytochrome c peroxidase
MSYYGNNAHMTGVGGINDVAGLPASFCGTCGTCHDTPHRGEPFRFCAIEHRRRRPGESIGCQLPSGVHLQNNAAMETVMTADPGRALITGKWADIGKFKGPILRGLASRAPYFHNGLAGSLSDVITFYEKRFSIGLTAQERADLIAFLNAL